MCADRVVARQIAATQRQPELPNHLDPDEPHSSALEDISFASNSFAGAILFVCFELCLLVVKAIAR